MTLLKSTDQPTLLHYMVLVSEHNLAELRACLYWQPRYIYLVITDRMQRPAERLYNVLAQQLPDSQIIRLTAAEGQSFKGERFEEIQHWIAQTVLPLFAQVDPATCALNFTGSTKSLAFSLTHALAWAELHYQPFDKTTSHLWLERMYWRDGQMHSLPAIDLASRTLNLYDAVNLYMDDAKPVTPNSIFSQPDSLPLAQLRLDAQTMSQAQPDNPWPVLTTHFERVWYATDYARTQKTVRIGWDECLLERAVLQPFLQRLADLCPTKAILEYDDAGFYCPTPHHKGSSSWRKWICGDWFEQLVQHWLITGGVSVQNLAAGLKIHRENDQGREVDIVLMHQHNLHVLEIKADVPRGESMGKFEEQLSSSSSALGKVTKVLVLAPAILHQLSDDQKQAFELRCKTNQVTVIFANRMSALGALLPTSN
jgi:hypothetical protein